MPVMNDFPNVRHGEDYNTLRARRLRAPVRGGQIAAGGLCFGLCCLIGRLAT
jgi:hypothetical protein